MLRVLAFFATLVSAVKLNGEETSMLQMKMSTKRMRIPEADGMMSEEGSSLTDSMGVMDLDAVMDMDNEPDENTYPGENLQMEKANEQATRFHNTRITKVRHQRHGGSTADLV